MLELRAQAIMPGINYIFMWMSECEVHEGKVEMSGFFGDSVRLGHLIFRKGVNLTPQTAGAQALLTLLRP